jgi:hypothetical protein
LFPGRGGDGSGGGVSVAGGTATLDTVGLLWNFAGGGTGGGAIAGTTGSGGDGFGGGLYVAAGTVTMTNATVRDNRASGGDNAWDGFAISPIPGYGEGGGIYNAGTLTLSGCTISDNVAQGDFYFGPAVNGEGGGIYNAASGTLDVTNGSTVISNHAASGADLYNLGTADISSDSTVGLIGP